MDTEFGRRKLLSIERLLLTNPRNDALIPHMNPDESTLGHAIFIDVHICRHKFRNRRLRSCDHTVSFTVKNTGIALPYYILCRQSFYILLYCAIGIHIGNNFACDMISDFIKRTL